MGESTRNQILVGADIFRASAGPLSLEGIGGKVLGHLRGDTTLCNAQDILDIGRNFIYTEVGAGGTAGVVQAPSSTLPAVAQFTTGASQHNNQQVQWAKGQTASTTAAGTATAFAPFLIKASANPGDGGNNIHFRSRLRLRTNISNGAFFVGLAVVSTTIFGSSVPSASDMVGFYKASGAATVAGLQRAGSSNTLVTLSNNTLVADTWYDFGFLISERNGITFWLNGTRVGGDNTGTSVLPANTVALCPSFVVSAGTAAVATAQVRSIMTLQDGGF